MLIGHYSVALALKKTDPSAPLGLLFIAVQLADILFFILLLLGIEQGSIVAGLTEASDLRLNFAPFTHGLLGAVVLGMIVYVIFRLMPSIRGVNRHRLGLVMAIAVVSHWVLDVIVHTPDMHIVDGGLPRIGLGLWHSALATYAVEAVLVLGGLWLYQRATRGRTTLGKFGVIGLVGLMLLFNVFNLFQPPPEPDSSLRTLAIPALVGYFLVAGVAYWLDRKRAPQPEDRPV